MSNLNTSLEIEVGIIVPTMDRPDFTIRLLNYYAQLSYPFTIYIGDSSNQENSTIIQNEINRLRDKIKVDYRAFHEGDGIKCIIYLLSLVKEKYVTFIGDDDYNVPETIFACAKFLEDNPEYETATGKSVTIRVENNQAHGRLTSIHDYPRYSIEANSAPDRLYHHLGVQFNSIIASVLPTKNMLRYYQAGSEIKDPVIRGEMLPCSLMVIAGKSKVLDRIGLVRQIHIRNLRNEDIFDEITNMNWPESYKLTAKILADELMAKGKLTRTEAEEFVKKCFWANIRDQLNMFYPQFVKIISPPELTSAKKKINIRVKIGEYFPIVKKAYRHLIKPMLAEKKHLHYEVLQPDSKYYKDFLAISKSVEKRS